MTHSKSTTPFPATSRATSVKTSLKTSLTTSQAAALECVARRAGLRASEAEEQIEHILQMSDIGRERFDQAVDQIASHARVALHFHPDRPGPGGRSVAAALLDEGVYRSQFETRISNGGLSAYPGGARQRWEKEIFGDAYEAPGSTAAERPKYGALDLMLHADGPSPRFGSCRLVLSQEASHRCSFTYLDSHENPDQKGTLEAFSDIASALLQDAFVNESALGERDVTTTRLVDHLATRLSQPFMDPSAAAPGRNLDHYVEAQVHGDVSVGADAEILVADPCFAGTQTGDLLEALCLRYDVGLHWHVGFALALDEVPSDFRGPTMPSLARRISSRQHVDASMIGAAAVALKEDPDSYRDRGTCDEVLQELKLLWHVLVRHGRPFRDFSN